MKTTSKNKVPCRVSGCDHEPFNSRIAETTHYHRAHSGRIRVTGQKKQPTGSGEHPESINLGTERPAPANTDPKPKRKYTKRQTQKRTLRGKMTEVEILFCPRCLTSLHPVAIGMVMAKANSNVNGCPRCGLDLRVVAAGMTMAVPAR